MGVNDVATYSGIFVLTRRFPFLFARLRTSGRKRARVVCFLGLYESATKGCTSLGGNNYVCVCVTCDVHVLGLLLRSWSRPLIARRIWLAHRREYSMAEPGLRSNTTTPSHPCVAAQVQVFRGISTPSGQAYQILCAIASWAVGYAWGFYVTFLLSSLVLGGRRDVCFLENE